MPKGLKIPAYILTGLVSFVIFLYLTFPFDVLKDRLLVNFEKNIPGYKLKVGSVSPRLIAGLNLKSVQLMKMDDQISVPFIESDWMKLKASIISLISGSPKIKFDLASGDGKVEGKINQLTDEIKINMELDDFDLQMISYLAKEYGLKLKSEMDGIVNLELSPKQFIRSSGTVMIKPKGIKVLPSKLKLEAFGEIPIPALTVGAGESEISAELKRGALRIKKLILEKGDIDLDLKGAIYLSSQIQNLRLNLRGKFRFSDKFAQVLPFLFIIEKQKDENGWFPLTIAGRLSKPQIKIGDFTVPL